MARIAFVDTMACEKLGVLYLSAVLKARGHAVDVFLRPLEADLAAAVRDFKPDFVAFSCFLGQESDVLECFTAIKAAWPRARTIQGGPATVIYTGLIAHPAVDFVMIGDGEETLPDLVETVIGDKSIATIPGVLWKQAGAVARNSGAPLINNFEAFPAADRDLFMKYDTLRKARLKPFLMTRGCPYPCTYCGTGMLNSRFKGLGSGGHFRYGVGERTIAEIDYVKRTYGLEWVQFHDATFNANRKFTLEFLERYAATDLPPFLCNIRSENVTAELVEAMKAARCDRVTMGVQSGSEEIRKELSGRRTQTDANIVEACRLFKRHGIRVHIDLIFGWPGETVADAMRITEILRAAPVDKLSSNVMIYYPDAEITRRAHQQGYLDEFPDVFDVARLSNPFQVPLRNTPDIARLINLDKLIPYLGHSAVLSYPPIRDLLLAVPPNRFYLLLKRFPELRLNLKYDARDNRERLRMVRDYLGSHLRAGAIQRDREAQAAKSRKAIRDSEVSELQSAA